MNTIDYTKYKLNNGLRDSKSIQILLDFFLIFKCRIIFNSKLLDLYQYFVLVNRESPLLANNRKKLKFCYYVDQKRETFLMTFTEVLALI
jgi:hypothetical protein